MISISRPAEERVPKKWLQFLPHSLTWKLVSLPRRARKKGKMSSTRKQFFPRLHSQSLSPRQKRVAHRMMIASFFLMGTMMMKNNFFFGFHKKHEQILFSPLIRTLSTRWMRRVAFPGVFLYNNNLDFFLGWWWREREREGNKYRDEIEFATDTQTILSV